MSEILVVDDDANLGTALKMALQQEGHTCRLAKSVEAGWEAYRDRKPDLALLDLRLPDGDGLELLERIRGKGIDVPVILMTAFGTVSTAVSAIKSGAADFIEKPLSVREVCALVGKLMREHEVARHLDNLNVRSGDDNDELTIVGDCPEMQKVLAFADRVASLPDQPPMGLNTTLLLGETGTGKEMVARYIHRRSPWRDGPFVHVNCTAIPENLFESEHFGYERGTFTDAKSRKHGLIEMAHEGTLFLDEIGDMPLALQGKLLVAIETGRFRRLGATTEQKVDMRVIAATNTDLEAKVKEGSFRGDLYHRLRIFCIELPPLRQRGDDVLQLTEVFLERFAARLDKPVPKLSLETRSAMQQYGWPGNVRELAHVLLRAIVFAEGDTLLPEHLGVKLETAPPPRDDGEDGTLTIDLSRGGWTLDAVERKLLEVAMERARGNIAEAARMLSMPRGTLRYRLEKAGLLEDTSPE